MYVGPTRRSRNDAREGSHRRDPTGVLETSPCLRGVPGTREPRSGQDQKGAPSICESGFSTTRRGARAEAVEERVRNPLGEPPRTRRWVVYPCPGRRPALGSCGRCLRGSVETSLARECVTRRGARRQSSRTHAVIPAGSIDSPSRAGFAFPAGQSSSPFRRALSRCAATCSAETLRPLFRATEPGTIPVPHRRRSAGVASGRGFLPTVLRYP
jgi:hypothetical protein